MKPLYISDYIEKPNSLFGIHISFDSLRNEVAWVNRDAPRDECFMASDSLEYTYGKGVTRTYNSVEFHSAVLAVMEKLNIDFDCSYNVCFLNYYKSDKQHLGWHADDSPEMDKTHPIAVVTFGAVRDIWVKQKDYKGNIPDEDKYLLENGSLFVMPPGFQEDNLHKIPKHDKVCGGRISLTFRKFINR